MTDVWNVLGSRQASLDSPATDALDQGLNSPIYVNEDNAPFLDLSAANQERLIDAARNRAQVSGLTHNFYRYPARFSPEIARAAIEIFSEPGDIVADSFVGGGTTLVEALAAGRHALGTDVSTLASFVSSVKTTLMDDASLDGVLRWADATAAAINMRDPSPEFADWEAAGYLRNLDHRDRWRLRKAIAQAVSWVPTHNPAVERLTRCILLRTAQWALDGRKTIPTLSQFKLNLVSNAGAVVEGLKALGKQAGANSTKICVLNRSAVGLEEDPEVHDFLGGRSPRLILTSPPYPGVHVLYHRWQVDGRKETRAPFWIANSLDGAGASYYTMGDRKQQEQTQYFETLRGAQRSIAAISDSETTILQIVAFSQPESQLARYNDAARAAGLKEFKLPILDGIGDGRLWREVPNRRWYTGQRAPTASSNEVVLFYQLAR